MSNFFFTRIIFLSFVILFASTLAFAQTPTATPPNDDGDVVKISTNLIQLDVVVTDKKGNQVTDLKPEDFEIYENGKKQDITNFSYIFNKSANQPTDSQVPNSKEKFDIPAPPSKLKLEQVRRTYALVVDDLGLSFENVPTIKYSLKKFIDEQMQEGDLVAIIRTGSGIGALQSFTSDKRQLLAAIEKIKWNSYGRGDVNAFAAVRPPLSGDEKDKGVADFRNESFSIGTLGALSYVVRGMKQLPGRKSVVLISEGFQVLSEQGGRLAPTRIYDGLRTLADLANRSSVIFYTLDPRGLVSPYGLQAEDNTFTLTDTGIAQQQQTREQKFFDSQNSLVYLANETGGISYINQNKLDVGLQKAVEDQNGYYLIGYQPESDAFDPKKNKFNKFTVKVKRDDLTVRYRSGFFGVTDEKIAQVKQTPAQQIYDALTSPFNSGGIGLSLNTIFGDDPKEGAFIRSLIHIDGDDLKFLQEANGKRKATFDVLAMTFGDNGAPIDQVAKTYTIQVGEKEYQQILKQGFVYNLPVPIKKAGAYQFRVALRDTATEKIGSASQFIEVPNLKKKDLIVSGIILNAHTIEQWQKASNPPKIKTSFAPEDEDVGAFADTALRRFRQKTVLEYDYIVYNAKLDAEKKPQIQVQTRLFRDNKLILESKLTPVKADQQTDFQRIQNGGLITLGIDLAPGNYVLQVVVKDNLTDKFTSQFIDFEIVE